MIGRLDAQELKQVLEASDFDRFKHGMKRLRADEVRLRNLRIFGQARRMGIPDQLCSEK